MDILKCKCMLYPTKMKIEDSPVGTLFGYECKRCGKSARAQSPIMAATLWNDKHGEQAKPLCLKCGKFTPVKDGTLCAGCMRKFPLIKVDAPTVGDGHCWEPQQIDVLECRLCGEKPIVYSHGGGGWMHMGCQNCKGQRTSSFQNLYKMKLNRNKNYGGQPKRSNTVELLKCEQCGTLPFFNLAFTSLECPNCRNYSGIHRSEQQAVSVWNRLYGERSVVIAQNHNKGQVAEPQDDYHKAKHDAGKLPLNLIPPSTYDAIGRVMQYGAGLYGENTWQHLPDGTKRCHAALLRHLVEWHGGEKVDPGSGLPHLEHVLWNAAVLVEFEK